MCLALLLGVDHTDRLYATYHKPDIYTEQQPVGQDSWKSEG